MKKFDLVLVLNATANKREYLKNLTNMVNDVQKEKRLKSQECQVCFYSFGKGIGGAAMTRSNCISCEKEMMYGNTYTDLLCLDCAVSHKLCKHCVADINLKNRKKL